MHLEEKKILKSRLAFGTKVGFGLIELIFVLFIVGIVATIVIPNFSRLIPGKKKQEFIARMNAVCQLGWVQALRTQTLHRILFDIQNGTIALQKAQPLSAEQKELQFATVERQAVATTVSLGKQCIIKKCFIDGIDYANRTGITTETLWFYIDPTGMAQEVTLVCADESDPLTQAVEYTLVLNPFTLQFSQQ